MKNFLSMPKPLAKRIRHCAFVFMLSSLALTLLPPREASGQWFLFGRAQRRYNRCVQLYETKQYGEARQCTLEFLSNYPHSRWVEHLQFLDAKMETNMDKALVKLRRFVMEFPNGPYSAEANFSLGELYELRDEPASALKYYSRTYLHFGASELRDEAGLRMAKCMLLNEDIQSAKSHLEIYVTTHRVEPWLTRAKELHADALYMGGEYTEAQSEYRGIISDAPSPEEAPPRCYLRVAEIYENSGDHEAAFQAYRRFLNIFPNSIQKQSVEQKLAMLASVLKVDLSVSDRAHIVEAGSFKSEPEALSLVARLKKLGYRAYVVTKSEDHGEDLSVRLGPYESRNSALAVADRLNKETGLEAILLPQGGLF